MKLIAIIFVLFIANVGVCSAAEEPALKIPPGLKTNAEFILQAAEAMAKVQDTLGMEFLYDRNVLHGFDARQTHARWMMLRNPTPELLPQPVVDTSVFPSERNLLPRQDPKAERVELPEMRPGPWRVEELRPLLKHENPKVRTLGIMLLYQLNRCDVLPDIAALAKDEELTFRNLLLGATVGSKAQYEEQRVSKFAVAVLNAWSSASAELRAARYDPSTTPPEVLERFIQRRHPTLNTASLVIALQRMTASTSPLPGDRRQRVEQLFMLLDRIEQPRRFFVANRLGFDYLNSGRYPADYPLRLAREVQRDIRLKAVFGERAIDDPDLDDFGQRFFREHAVELFRAEDSERFLKAAKAAADDHGLRHEYAANMVTAADLDSTAAENILLAALNKLEPKPDERPLGEDARLPIAIAMALRGEEAGIKTALNWFFQNVPERGAYGFGREAFLGRIQLRNPALYRRVVERIIRDPRLGTIGTASTRMLVEATHGYLGRMVVSAEEYRQSFGFPESELDRRFDKLDQWHKALTDSVNKWSQENSNQDKSS